VVVDWRVLRWLYEIGVVRVAAVDELVGRASELPARTVIIDVGPPVAYWASAQDLLDQGVPLVLGQVAAIPGSRVVCLATNSPRQPSVVPAGGNVRVVYLDAANKPLRVSPYLDFLDQEWWSATRLRRTVCWPGVFM
jgi:hypothetical protein